MNISYNPINFLTSTQNCLASYFAIFTCHFKKKKKIKKNIVLQIALQIPSTSANNSFFFFNYEKEWKKEISSQLKTKSLLPLFISSINAVNRSRFGW
jgi:hypothetical protein